MQFSSNSGLTRHRTCPQAWVYRSLQKLEQAPYPEDTPVEKHFGSWMHALLAADSIERARSYKSLQWCPEVLTTVDYGPTFRADSDTLVQDVLDGAQTWYSKQSEQHRAQYVARLGEGLPERLLGLLVRYQNQWLEERLYERPLAVELKWERQLPGVDVTLVGYIDEIYLDTRRNIVVCRDHKWHKKLAPPSTAEDMMDSQLQLYSWGAAPIVQSWGPEHRVRATAYDRGRMTLGSTPVLTQSGTLSKSVTDYDLETYREWAAGGQPYPGRKADGSGAGVYEEDPSVVEKLSLPTARAQWWQRTLTPVNPNVVRAHLQAAVDTARDIAVTVKRYETRQDAARSFGKACQWCDYSKLCRAQLFGGPTGEYDLAEMGLRRRSERS